MTQFSANLGFLWQDRRLPEAILAAKGAGFAAVECHWPYEIPSAEVKETLQETGLPMLCLNTRRGDVAAGDNGLAAVPGREAETRDIIDEALDYAAQIGASHLHVMAGRANGPKAQETFYTNLHYACRQAARHGQTILIEPLNSIDAPGYFLNTTQLAAQCIADVAAPNLRLMFDCYHVGRTEGDVIGRLRALFPIIGHIQFASTPDRGTPDHGDVDYTAVFTEIERLGWTQPLGAEYRPTLPTDQTLDWMTTVG